MTKRTARSAFTLSSAFLAVSLLAGRAPAATPPRGVEFRFTPASRAQLALWIEKPDGTFMGTVRLTQAVSTYGIGNRPGASQMNSGFRWPYGRRLDALPVWAHRRAAAPGALLFKQVIFQHRRSEGCASNANCGGADSSPDPYFCLSFMRGTTRKEALDAVSCATPFASDKGRYLTPQDVQRGYAEPVEVNRTGVMRPLEPTALYPPRRDGAGCGLGAACIDHPDAATYPLHAREVMPDIDAVTMATPPSDREESILFTIPDSWPDGDYVAWVEVNVEGDHNGTFSTDAYRVPQTPAGEWDGWAIDYGYPYRGQPSVVYSVPFSTVATATSSATAPTGYGDIDGFGASAGRLNPMDAKITNDAAAAVGSGADRLRLVAPRDYRLQVNVRDRSFCKEALTPPQRPGAIQATMHADEKHTHEWGQLQFVVPPSERAIDHYEVRYSKAAITGEDPSTFARALPARAAVTDSVALVVPMTAQVGGMVNVPFGGMEPLTRYFVAVRAVDACNEPGPYSVAELTTSKINFTQLSGCFIATAAYGSALQPQVEALRTVRDAVRPRSPLFAVFTDLYYRSGPAAAAVLSRSDSTRALMRGVIAPVADLARLAAPALRR